MDVVALATAASTAAVTPAASIQAIPAAPWITVSPTVAFLGSTIAFATRVAFWLLTLITYHIPRWTLAVLSWGGVISLEFNAVKLFLLFVGFSIGLNWYIKVQFLNKYTELKETPLRTDEKLDLHPDVATESSTGGISNYLDEFLSAIRVFGYLEKPVFHELARHLQTKRLIAGDTLSLDSSDFYVVVDGTMQVYAQMTAGAPHPQDFDEDGETNGYQLLNEVFQAEPGVSNREDVKLRYEEADSSRSASRRADSVDEVPDLSLDGASLPTAKSHHYRQGSRHGQGHAPRTRGPSHLRNSFSSGTTIADDDSVTTPVDQSTADPSRPKFTARAQRYAQMPSESALSSDEESEATHTSARPSRSVSPLYSTHPNGHRFRRPRLNSIQTEVPENYQSPRDATIARAKVDCTLAVIPAEAFKKLTKKFPKASAHIVQVILTRLHRVTFLTAHEYLGLTKELVKTEKAINDIASYPLPPEFYESGGIERLRQRFLPETKAVDRGREDADSDYFSALEETKRNRSSGSLPVTTPYMGPRMGRNMHTESSASLGPDAVRLKYRASPSPLSATQSASSSSASTSPPQAASSIRSRESSGSMSSSRISRNVGDLLTMTTLDPSSALMSTSPDRHNALLPPIDDGTDYQRQRHSSFALGLVNEFDLREAVMTCISKSIGLIQPSTSVPASVETSPLFQPIDAPLKRAVFTSSLGSLSFLGTTGPDDASSVTASSMTGSLDAIDLENETEILFFPRNSTLVKAGERGAGLFFVIEGWLDVLMPDGEVGRLGKANTTSAATSTTQSSNKTSDRANRPHSRTGTPSRSGASSPPAEPNTSSKAPKILFSVKPGGIAGYLSSLSGFPSYVDIKAKTDVYVGFLPAKALERIMDKKPIVLLTLAKRLISLLPPLVVQIDSALEWMQVNAGHVIYRQDEKADSIYFVNQGRLRSIAEKPGTGGVEILGEFGQGDSVGELDCITDMPRPSTLHAIRDSELTRMPMTLLNAISTRYPSTALQISRLIGQRVRQEVDAKKSTSLAENQDLGQNNFNLKTVCILPVTYQVPVTEFANRLKSALEDIGAPASYLNQATVMHVQGRHAFSKMGKLKLAGWLSETEQKYRIVLYVADTAVSSPWTQTCIRQADCILLVAHGASDPAVGEYERLLVGMKTTARKELVLLHSERAIPAGSTRPWLKLRPWIHAWSHCEMPDAPSHRMAPFVAEPAPVVAIKNLRNKVQLQIGKYRRSGTSTPHVHRPTTMSDFARLARRLCGQSIGVVLGGGGARGISHIGVLKALYEAGIPVDMVGGTSIGSFVGGLYAREGDLVSTLGRAKRFSGRMSSMWRILTDVTYPIVAYTTGYEFNRGIYKSFYDYHIEDMWLTFFCNTTNITHSRMDVHTTGYAWRYIRASMTLVGLLPPLSDEGNMLVDGGYTDNLPVSVMMRMGANSVFAVDVGSIDDTSPREFGESISGWWVLLNRWNPWSSTRNVPSITEIQSRLTYVSSVKTLEEAKATPGVLYMRMPVEQYGTMQFGKFTEIMDVGYQAAQKMITQWKKEGKIPTGLVENGIGLDGKGGPIAGRPGAARLIRRNSI